MAHLETSERPAALALDSSGYDAVMHAAGVVVLEARIVVRVIGDDRASFFHGMCTADVKGARPGAILPALFLTEHAHVIADAFIWVTAGALILDIDANAWTRTRAHLERLLVADDVEFEDAADLAVLDVEGPAALDATGVSSLAPWSCVEAGGSLVGNLPRYGGPAASVIASRDSIDATIASILAKTPGSSRVDPSVLETIRVENGVALVGVDTADKTIALEARLNGAISFNKGCYLGQETIERATARGGLKRRMFGLKFSTADAPYVGAVLTLAGKEVGRVTSAVRSPRRGAIGLAILHHSAWTPGMELKVGEDGAATVVDLPFAQN
ncbi:MAG: glycine cleavage T C-terminal barrel domain-containing protein [Candidatus Binatus sp.]